MMTKTGSMIAAGVLALACSANDGTTESTGQTSEAIVRGTTENGRNYVMELRIAYNSYDLGTGEQNIGYCSSVLFAPRVLLTAAHCLNPIRNAGDGTTFVDSPNTIIAYIGNNFEADFAALGDNPYFAITPPPAASRFMRADSWETHPSWNRTTLYADLAAVYLDRQPRIPPGTIVDPLPVGRNRLGTSDVGSTMTIVGYGASVAYSADIQQNAGGLIKRRGTTKLVGAPVINPLPPDPHPGVLNTTIRNSLLQTNGKAPNANTCAGDSGGPVIKNVNGQDFVFGIGTWTGNWCEDFSYFTRMDPFLSFVDTSYLRGGQAPTRPRLECIAPRPGGGYRAYFGYKNENGVSVSVPYGANNSFPQDTTNQRPSVFAPGDHAFEFRVNFNAGQTLSYKLSPPNSPTTQLTVNQSSPQCSPTNRSFICAQSCEAALTAQCGETFGQCMDFCESLYQGITPCEPAMDEYNQCVAQQPASDFECFDGFTFSNTCFPLLDAVFTECLAGG